MLHVPDDQAVKATAAKATPESRLRLDIGLQTTLLNDRSTNSLLHQLPLPPTSSPANSPFRQLPPPPTPSSANSLFRQLSSYSHRCHLDPAPPGRIDSPPRRPCTACPRAASRPDTRGSPHPCNDAHTRWNDQTYSTHNRLVNHVRSHHSISERLTS